VRSEGQVDNELHGLEPLTSRDWTWIATETTAAVVVWVFAVGLLLASYVHPSQWLSELLQFGGAMALVMGILSRRVSGRSSRAAGAATETPPGTPAPGESR
jgi:threonine/homoserine/homoserine lactone efflux protein